jgi:acyl transferase domain-containing protein/acyl carrier protein/DNA-binding transcriptional regulator YhcF (GntR family)
MKRRSEIRRLQEFEPLAELQLGYVTIPVLIACKKKGLFNFLHTDVPISLTSLAETLHARPEHLQTAFQLFESSGWIRLVENRGYVITKEAQQTDIPHELSELYDSPIETILANPSKQQELAQRIRTLAERPHASSELNRLSEGAILVPFLLALHQTAKPGSSDPFSNVDDSLRDELIVLLTHRGWWESNGETSSWSKQGRLLIENANLFAIAISYRPMLAKIEDRLFYSPARPPQTPTTKNGPCIATSSSPLSLEIQRSLFFENVEEQVASLFDRLPIEQQPRFISHVGCGNGIFLRQLFHAIRTKTQRGEMLDEAPLTLVGIDSNQANRVAAAKTLADLPHIILSSDLNHPRQLLIEFEEAGIVQPETILYIRSIEGANGQSSENVPANPKGIARNNSQADLDSWATLLEGNPHGLFITEAHRIDPRLEPHTTEHGPLFFLDILTAFSGSPELNAETFLNQAASLGLFAQNQPLLFPQTAPFRRFSFSHFEKRHYRVRPAHPDDLPDLYRLEALCWNTELGTPKERLARRIKKYPQGQFVLESEGRVLGVIYSQRIDNIEALSDRNTDDVEALHQANGPVVQLLAVNIDPAAQSKQLGDQLLEFMLQRCAALSGVHSTIGVTLCKEFHKQSSASMKQYIQKRSKQGVLRDPILRFHELHGAKIVNVMPQYRPCDLRNEGYGVLVYYDLFNRKRREIGNRRDIPSNNNNNGNPPSKDLSTQKTSVVRFVESLIRQMLEEEEEITFSEETPLMELGLDSANLLMLSERISSKFNEDLEPAFFFEHNTCKRIVSYFTNKMRPPKAPQERTRPVRHSSRDEVVPQSDLSNQIAIIGISCRLPGEINNPQDLWTLLKNGESAIGKMPQGRWNWPRDLDLNGEHRGIDRGGFLTDIACFDAPFFRLSPREAEAMDPQQRILLELAWAAFEDAGYSPDTLSRSKTGVFIGASGSDYRLLLEQNHATIESHMGTGNSMAILANRISYFFDLRGPSLLIDTACSSSLVAVHEAVQAIRSGTCSQALVGGINIICHPGNTISYYKAGMLSQEGLCKTFDDGADGYVRSEGAVMVMLKPLEAAIADQDQIHGVIRGSATNHGGQAGGLTVPNPEQQAELLKEAWADAGVGPENIGYIETHGTGTSLGDPIEVRGLREAFSCCTKEHLNLSSCGLSSVKSNLGHLEAAAGLAGLLKVVLSLKHQALVPTINFQTLNSKVRLGDSPFFVVDQFQNWPLASEPESPKMAGVSSFGSGGANAHVIIEEFRHRPIVSNANSPRSEQPPFIIVLSAKNSDRLKSLAQNLLSFIEPLAEDCPLSLERIAYTLQKRQSMEERAAFIVNSFSEFRDLLKNLIQSKTEPEGIYRGNSRTTKEWALFFNSNLEISPLLNKWLIDGQMGQVAELWVKGVHFNWELIYKAKPQHLSLPSYPFAKERYWHASLSDSTKEPAKKDITHASSHTSLAPIKQSRQNGSSPIQVPISLAAPMSFRRSPTTPGQETKKRALQPVNQIWKPRGTGNLSPSDNQQSIVTFQNQGMGLYSIRIDDPDQKNRLSDQVIDGIQKCFDLIQAEADAKVILISGGDRFFLTGGAAERKSLFTGKALSLTGVCKLPVIAAMKGSCLGTGWLLASLCDFMVCSKEGLYQYHLQEDTWLPSQEDAALFTERFGRNLTTFLFHSSKPLTGDALKAIGLGIPTLPRDEVEAYAMDLAMTLAKCPQESLVQLKRNLSKGVSEQAQRLELNGTPPISPPNLPIHGHILDDPWTKTDEGFNIGPTGEPKRIDFPSDVVSVKAYDNGVVLVTLCDKKSKNTFSDAFLKGVAEVFEYIRSNENFKIVVLTGYEQYFCCGGTKDGLLAIQEGSTRFTDLKIFSVALECDLPVIAAMQGHAIGAGWAMGLFCDVVIFSEESVYQAPYMQYGFTPGAGSTLAFPQKLGKDLAWEVLFSGKDFRGSDLRNREVGLKILPRSEVEAYALKTAHQLALSSREDLRQSKIELCKNLRLQLKSVLAQELAMHEKTFVGNQQVGKNIQEMFREGTNEDSPENPKERASETNNSSVSDTTILSEIRKTLTTTLAEELYMKSEAVIQDLPFLEMGLDSITGVTWIRKINKLFGLSITATKVYSHPTIQALAKHLRDEMGERDVFQFQQIENPSHSSPVNEDSPIQANTTIPSSNLGQTTSTTSNSQEEKQPRGIAVIGISGQFPQARTTTEFWDNIIEGKDCITEIPSTRWSVDRYFDPKPQVPGKTNSKWMGHLEDADKFDPLFFNISPLEAAAMDPQQRLFLEACWGCIEDAGYAPGTLSGSRCGVFAGCAPSDYGQQIDPQEMSAQRFMGGATSILAARISYLLNLHGPCLAIDTACSSSLVAIATGCDSLRNGNSDLVLAGGVCVMAGPGMHIMTSNAGMLSPEGRCFAFDQSANGFVPGEGVGVVMLKRLEDAERDGDNIYGVIRGWGINQDGRTNGITAPSAESQSRLERDVYKRFNIDPAGIQLMEAHGTGTKLGDPIEIEGLSEAFASYTQRRAYCALGSVKSNIGHLLMAAGVASLIKVLLAIKHQKLPPTLHINRLNEHLKLDDSPFYLNTSPQEWKVSEGENRRAAINSFGFSGTNSHMVIEEYSQSIETELHINEAPCLIVLSAKNNDSLRNSAENLVKFIKQSSAEETQVAESRVRLADIAFTLQVGRDAMDERLGLVSKSLEELREQLNRYLDGETEIEGLYRGQIRLDQQTVTPQNTDNDKAKDIAICSTLTMDAELLKRWVAGEPIDWEKQYGKDRPSRINLPSYPFSKQSYWAYSDSDHKGSNQNWIPCPLRTNIKWDCQLRNYEGKSITVLYSNHEDKNRVLTLLQKMEQAANLRRPINVSAVNLLHDWTDQTLPKPDVILYIPSQGTEGISYPLDFPQKLSLWRDNDSETPVFFYGNVDVSDNRSDETLISISAPLSELEGYAWRWIGHDQSNNSETRIQLLLQEWLSDDITGNSPSAFKETRYEGANRFTRNEAESAIPENNEGLPWLLEKKWRLEIPDTSQLEAEPSNGSNILILVNNESAKIGQALFRNSSSVKTVLHNDFYTSAKTGRLKAIKIAKERQQNVLLIDLSNLYATPHEEDLNPIGQVTFYQTLIESIGELNILVITQGLQHFRSEEMSLAGAKFVGLIKMLSAEYPQVKAKCLDIDQTYFDSPNELSTILSYESKVELKETEICYRDGDRYIPYIDANQTKETIRDEIGELPLISNSGVYIISGGTSGIGLEIGKHLASKGARNLVLMGITPLPPKENWKVASQAIDTAPSLRRKLTELIDLDRQVDRLEIYIGSISNSDRLSGFFDRVRKEAGTIKGVIHSAGIYSDTKNPAFVKKDPASISKVWEPKVRGMETLHQLCKHDKLDFFISFSSLTGLIPELARGVSDYAMANAFLDFFASFQFHQKNKTYYKSITWVDWNDTGFASRSTEKENERLEGKVTALGLRTYSREKGHRIFEASLKFPERNWVLLSNLGTDSFNKAKPHLLYAKKKPTHFSPQTREKPAKDSLHHQLENWEKRKSLGNPISISTLTQHVTLEEIRQLNPSIIHRIYLLLATETSESPLPSQVTHRPKSDLDTADDSDLAETVRGSLAVVLELPEVDPNVPFQNYGLDSITAVVLSGRLERSLNLEIPPKWFINFPTVNSLSSHLSTQKVLAKKLDS